ncbi:MAG TPA: hypothetical protein PKG96_08300 [Bacilli bacterium]|jgi:Tfp pilus assembly protein PilP|nr:hypothetical protein [Bacilli bacterium]
MFNRKLRPGQQGTKKLVEQYGDRLLNVRYIYNAISEVKMKTVVLVEEQKPWTKKRQYIPPNKIMHLKVEYDEVQIRNLVKSCGGRWNKEKGYWEIAYRQVQILGLENRILNN